MSDYQGAIADFNEAICLQSNDPDVYYGRGSIKLQQGNYQSAISDYQEALRKKLYDLTSSREIQKGTLNFLKKLNQLKINAKDFGGGCYHDDS
ncbi:tetratricopeptide repeat protein [Halomicronema sp. CCY15110]|uniref:tetratricopeptide repeat protein n=1 Tax=Halomicronema sp. CCY15110 TaxID=2767773 RepID=UPI00194E0203